MEYIKDHSMDLKLGIWDQASPLVGKALAWGGLFLAPIKPVMLAIGFLVIVDLVTGLYASKKRGEKITSNGIRRTITKSLAYMAAILCSHVMNLYFMDGVIDTVKVVSGLIAVTEFQSLMENLSSILKIDLWKALLEKLQGKKIVPELAEPPKEEAPVEVKPEEPKAKKKSKSKRKK